MAVLKDAGAAAMMGSRARKWCHPDYQTKVLPKDQGSYNGSWVFHQSLIFSDVMDAHQ